MTCDHAESAVTDSRARFEENAPEWGFNYVRYRRRKCKFCGESFMTFEIKASEIADARGTTRLNQIIAEMQAILDRGKYGDRGKTERGMETALPASESEGVARRDIDTGGRHGKGDGTVTQEGGRGRKGSKAGQRVNWNFSGENVDA